jgi:hypothetical protein
MADALRFAFAMTTDASGPNGLEALTAPAGGALQHWVGRLATGGAHPSGVQDPGAMRRMVLADLPAAAPTGFAATGNLWSWFGEQILPGDQSTPQGAAELLVNVMSIDAAHEEEFNDWYDTEHIARMKLVEGVLAARRFRALGGSTPTYAAFYHFAAAGMTRRPEWAKAAGTPWTARMQRFRTDNKRMLFTPAGG